MAQPIKKPCKTPKSSSRNGLRQHKDWDDPFQNRKVGYCLPDCAAVLFAGIGAMELVIWQKEITGLQKSLARAEKRLRRGT